MLLLALFRVKGLIRLYHLTLSSACCNKRLSLILTQNPKGQPAIRLSLGRGFVRPKGFNGLPASLATVWG